ncbi:MAG: GNAT family protein [bacterium]|nr:GNAT family protein [bacterium]
MANGKSVRGERVCLCPFEGEFWARGLGWYNDPEIIALTSDDSTPLTEEQFGETIQVDLDLSQSVVFGIQSVVGQPIGIGMLRSVDLVHGGCDLHLTIGERNCWNRGFGAEVVGLMCAYAFHTLGLHKVISTPFASNGRMIRCLEKCGFQKEGVLRDALRIGDGYIDVVIMGMIQSENDSSGPALAR